MIEVCSYCGYERGGKISCCKEVHFEEVEETEEEEEKEAQDG